MSGMTIAPKYYQDDADGDVHQEDATPRPVGHEDPAEYWPDHPADREDAGKQPDRPVPVLAEQVGDDARRRGHERAAADGLDGPEHDQQVDVAGEPAA
jgi:hypothetical protein